MDKLGVNFVTDEGGISGLGNASSCANRPVQNTASIRTMSNIPNPDPAWAEAHPDRFLTLLYVSPRPCDAFENIFKR